MIGSESASAEKDPDERLQSARDVAFDLESSSRSDGRCHVKILAVGSWLLFGILAAAQSESLPARAEAPSKAADLRTFDPDRMDRSVDPCEDFYHYACGTWIRSNPLPKDRGVWAPRLEIHERNLLLLREILEKASVPNPGRGAADQKSGDYYAACMDEKRIEAQGVSPLKDELDRIAGVSSREALTVEIAHLQAAGDVLLLRLDSSRHLAAALL